MRMYSNTENVGGLICSFMAEYWPCFPLYISIYFYIFLYIQDFVIVQGNTHILAENYKKSD